MDPKRLLKIIRCHSEELAGQAMELVKEKIA